MRLAGAEAARYLASPNLDHAALLIYGRDAMRVALKRQSAIAALLGKEADAQMRLTRIGAADVRSDPSCLHDNLKARGFFPGVQVLLVDDINDTQFNTVAAALKSWAAGDSFLIMTASNLTAKSKLRKLFENQKNTVAIGIYDDPPSGAEIHALLEKSGLRDIHVDAQQDLNTLAQNLDPGDFAQTVEKVALYKRNDPTPLTSKDVAVCAPVATMAAMDDILNIISEARTADVGPLLNRLTAQGVTPTGLCIAANMHFQTLYAAATDASGPEAALSSARPPVFGPRRNRMIQQARAWGSHRLESVLSLLMDADLTLRSTQPVPQMALVERAFIRIAMMRPK